MKDRLKPGGMSVSFCEHELRSSRNSKPTIFLFLCGVLFPVTAAGRCPLPSGKDSKETGAM